LFDVVAEEEVETTPEAEDFVVPVDAGVPEVEGPDDAAEVEGPDDAAEVEEPDAAAVETEAVVVVPPPQEVK